MLKCRYMNEVGQEKTQWLQSEIGGYKKLGEKKKMEMQRIVDSCITSHSRFMRKSFMR